MKSNPYTILLCALVSVLLTTRCTSTLGELPDFAIRQVDSTDINVSQFINGKTSLLIHFDANCKSCQDEAKAIVEHLDELGDVRVVFLSLQDLDLIDLFDWHFKLSEQHNIIIGQDYAHGLPGHLGIYTTPMTALIDKKKHIRKVITGEIEMPELVHYIDEIR